MSCTNNKLRSNIYKHDVSLDSIYTQQSKHYGVLLMAPHPSLGATMCNKVLKVMDDSFQSLGFSTLRFNFRGVGASQGSVADRSSDLSDSLWVVDYLGQLLPESKQLWVAGFGYGAYMAINIAMRRPCINGFVSVTPHYVTQEGLMSLLTPCPDGAIFHGTLDTLVPCGSAKNLAKALRSQEGTKVSFYPVNGANHNYKDKLDILQSKITSYVERFTEFLKPVNVNSIAYTSSHLR